MGRTPAGWNSDRNSNTSGDWNKNGDWNKKQRDVVQHGHDVDNVTANINSPVTKRYGEQITRESSIESART